MRPPSVGRWFAPSTDLTIHLFDTAIPGWIVAHYKAHHAGDGYASVEATGLGPPGGGRPPRSPKPRSTDLRRGRVLARRLGGGRGCLAGLWCGGLR
ncbi:MAG: hypothetical protein ACR2MB_06705 [Acidimicrobiales bacterium]